MRKKVIPTLTKSQINKAGKKIRSGSYEDSDIAIVEEWRAAHTYILNTFQANLRRRAKNKNIIVAERLKRRLTIFDKITREPTMALSTMQDIAGCRLIFGNLHNLNDFLKNFDKARFDHVRIDRDRFNYIENPKPDGYRGVHRVYEYKGSGLFASRWNGLCVEIQFRTLFHHAWATAVEIVGFLGDGQPKFGSASEEIKEFFRLTSEILARVYEAKLSCYYHLTISELLQKFNDIENKLNLLKKLESLSFVAKKGSNLRNVILILSSRHQLRIIGIKDDEDALEKYFDLERKASEGEDIVLVRSGNFRQIKNAYRNYFGDARDFVRFVRNGILTLEKFCKRHPALAHQIGLNL